MDYRERSFEKACHYHSKECLEIFESDALIDYLSLI
jgi:hypothetical protein